jgi:hypothetical protein
MFLGKHALFKGFGRVSGFDCNLRLPKDLAGIELFSDDVHRATADRIACFERSRVGV